MIKYYVYSMKKAKNNGIKMFNQKDIIIYLIVLSLLLFLSIIFFIFVIINNTLIIDFRLKGNSKINLEVHDEYIDEGYISYVNGIYCDCVKIDNKINKNKVGKYFIKYNFNYKLINKKLKRIVYVVDNTPPVINVESKKNIYLSKGEQLKHIPYNAIDNYDGNLTHDVKITSNVNINEYGKYHIMYYVIDSSGNVTKEKIIVNVCDKFDHTYIKISIFEQKLRYYIENELVLESDIVTGTNNATRKGNFKIWNKIRNTHLKGSDYISFVKYWMAYNGNSYGIHDASWRNRFGGAIYKYNGSHGCVNVPTDVAAKLYEMVEIGTPVYIY